MTAVAPPSAPRAVKVLMLATDLGFILYWAITTTHLLPASALFKDYQDSRIVAWNWSFLPLDLLVSATGLAGLRLRNRAAVLVSLVLTACSGQQAISFWTIRGDYSVAWWIPNLFLLLYPLPAIWVMLRDE